MICSLMRWQHSDTLNLGHLLTSGVFTSCWVIFFLMAWISSQFNSSPFCFSFQFLCRNTSCLHLKGKRLGILTREPENCWKSRQLVADRCAKCHQKYNFPQICRKGFSYTECFSTVAIWAIVLTRSVNRHLNSIFLDQYLRVCTLLY